MTMETGCLDESEPVSEGFGPFMHVFLHIHWPSSWWCMYKLQRDLGYKWILKNELNLVEMSSGYICFLHFFSHISACDRSDPQVCEPTDLFMS